MRNNNNYHLVANLSPQIVFCACICLDFAKLTASVFLHAVFRFATDSTCSIHLLPTQRHVIIFHFLIFSICTAFLLFFLNDFWLIAPFKAISILCVVIFPTLGKRNSLFTWPNGAWFCL